MALRFGPFRKFFPQHFLSLSHQSNRKSRKLRSRIEFYDHFIIIIIVVGFVMIVDSSSAKDSEEVENLCLFAAKKRVFLANFGVLCVRGEISIHTMGYDSKPGAKRDEIWVEIGPPVREN